MKVKIVKNKKLETWQKKYGDKPNLVILSKSLARRYPSKLDNKKWWLIGNKYYEVPMKKWLTSWFFVFGSIGLAIATVTPILCVMNCKGEIKVELPSTKTLQSGQTDTLEAKVTGSDENPTWTCDLEGVVTITGTGKTVTITAKPTSEVKTTKIIAKIGDKKSNECVVTVQPSAVKNYFTLTAENNSTLEWMIGSTGKSTLSYCTTEPADEKNWTKLIDSTTTPIEFGPDTTNGSKLYLKGTLEKDPTNIQGFGSIKINPQDTSNPVPGVTLSGNLMNLIQVDDKPATSLEGYDYAFVNLFGSDDPENIPGSMGLKAIDESEEKLLPATTLAPYCYKNMFAGCYSKIQSTATASYEILGLENAPSLPATTLTNSCYSDMFNYCLNLKELPNKNELKYQLPATNLAENCYQQMFRDCWSILSIPNSYLPATTLTNYCYSGMFSKCYNIITCDGLSTIPEDLLPAGKDGNGSLADYCYSDMFAYCAALENNIPENLLPAKTLATHCYEGMFNYCYDDGGTYITSEEKGLTSIPEKLLSATELAEGCYENMFAYCKMLETVPYNLLPATKLAESCYYNTFLSCSKLKNTPKLAATEYAENCYNNMFQDCSVLTLTEVKTTEKTTEDKKIMDFVKWGEKTEDKYALDMFSGTSLASGTPSYDYTYYFVD